MWCLLWLTQTGGFWICQESLQREKPPFFVVIYVIRFYTWYRLSFYIESVWESQAYRLPQRQYLHWACVQWKYLAFTQENASNAAEREGCVHDQVDDGIVDGSRPPPFMEVPSSHEVWYDTVNVFSSPCWGSMGGSQPNMNMPQWMPKRSIDQAWSGTPLEYTQHCPKAYSIKCLCRFGLWM